MSKFDENALKTDSENTYQRQIMVVIIICSQFQFKIYFHAHFEFGLILEFYNSYCFA